MLLLKHIPSQLDDVDGKTYLADITDAEACNWMMFVRPASSSSDQNLVAFQHDRSLFYLTTKNIKVGQELRVSWDVWVVFGRELYFLVSVKPSVISKSTFLTPMILANAQDQWWSCRAKSISLLVIKSWLI